MVTTPPVISTPTLVTGEGQVNPFLSLSKETDQASFVVYDHFLFYNWFIFIRAATEPELAGAALEKKLGIPFPFFIFTTAPLLELEAGGSWPFFSDKSGSQNQLGQIRPG